MQIDIELARKVLKVVDAGLVSGMGKPVPGQMCVEAAVNYAMGAPHGDEPACVSPALRHLKIRLNDSRWTTDAARTKGLRRLALAQLGSAGVLDEKEFVRRVAVLAMRGNVPKALRAVAALFRDGTATKERLLNAADICDREEPTQETAKKLRAIASEIRSNYYADAVAVAAADAVAVAVADADAAAAADAVADADADAVADAVAVAVADADAAAAADAVADAAADAVAAAVAVAVAVADAAAAADAVAVADAVAAAVAVAVADAAAVKKKFWEAYWKARDEGSAHRDAALSEFCEGVVQILIEMKAPGCQWLVLTEEAA